MYNISVQLRTLIFVLLFALALGVGGYLVLQSRTNDIHVESGKIGSVLDLASIGFAEVPASVFALTDVERLDLSGNGLHGSLPSDIRNLKALKVLNLRNNSLTGLPAEVGQLTELQILDLSHNQLTSLPHELGNLQKLQFLYLTGNNISEVDLAFIRAALPTTTVIVLD